MTLKKISAITVCLVAFILSSGISANAAKTWYNHPVNYTFTFPEDEYSGTDKRVYRLNGGQWKAVPEEAIKLQETTKIEIKSIDKASNESTVVTETVYINTIAPSAPKIEDASTEYNRRIDRGRRNGGCGDSK